MSRDPAPVLGSRISSLLVGLCGLCGPRAVAMGRPWEMLDQEGGSARAGSDFYFR